jgi:hypothetical protein
MCRKPVAILSEMAPSLVLETEIAVWRSHPNALFNLMRKNPIRDQIEYVLGKHELPSENGLG